MYCLGGYNAKPAAHVLQHLSNAPPHAIDYYVIKVELLYNKKLQTQTSKGFVSYNSLVEKL